MHIKQVFISGFKSYKDKVEVEPFSPHHNLVVGRNGTGKSNFFDAIGFCLLDSRYSHMSVERRKKLLHEGAGSNVVTAYVELVFDNSDGRMPVETKVVHLRRQIGVKKDEYFLNRRHVTRSDVSNMLEAAGFSRSNPYYVVQQGKVQQLCSMRDQDRLDLLKEVAGTSVYERRRQESTGLLEDSLNRRKKITGVVEYIESRLAELEEEKTELSEYQSLDKQRKALQYTLYDSDFRKAASSIEKLDTDRADETVTATEMHASIMEAENQLHSCEAKLATATADRVRVTGEIEATKRENKSLLEDKAQAEVELQDHIEAVEADRELRGRLQEELAELTPQIAEAKTKLENIIIPNFEVKKNLATDLLAKKGDISRQIETLYAKEGRPKERDHWIKNEIKQLKEVLGEKRKNATEIRLEISALAKKISSEQANLDKHAAEKTKQEHLLHTMSTNVQNLQDERLKQVEAKKEYWRRENEIAGEEEAAASKLKNGESVYQRACPRAISQGLSAVREIVKKKGLTGVHGPLIDLFTVSEKYNASVEVTANNSLFHVVVDTADVAAILMRELNRLRAGRLTFIPLDRVRVSQKELPKKSNEAFPIIRKLKYDSKLEKAFQQVFGRTFVCRDEKVASTFAHKHMLDCVTLDGAQVNGRGALDGGFWDSRFSKMAAKAQVAAASIELNEIREELRKVSELSRKADQRVTVLMGQMQQAAMKRQHMRAELQQCETERDHSDKNIKNWSASRTLKENQALDLESSAKVLSDKCDSLSAEIGTPLLKQLSKAEQSKLRLLTAELKKVGRKASDAEAELDRCRSQKSALEMSLSTNLERRHLEISQQLTAGIGGSSTMDMEERVRVLSSKRRQLKVLQKSSSDCNEQLNKLKEEKRVLSKRISTLQGIQEEVTATKQEREASLAEQAKQMEKRTNKRSLLIEKRDSSKAKISELGSLPESELQSYRTFNRKKLMKLLAQKGKALKKYSHVNKKALDQYVNFSEQREQLLARKTELDEGHRSIEDLLKVLDARKDEAIMRTFTDVAKHFSNVFKELVPAGNGCIVLTKEKKKKSKKDKGKGKGKSKENASDIGNTEVDSDEESDSDEDDKDATGKVKRINGISVKVSFTGAGEPVLMEQLSGGQKALVALTLIFAIQRCDPAPFYLFDEIDQALDSTHRASVAALIQRQAHSEDSAVQFITSTFWQEQVEVPDQHYGVAHQHKVSDLHRLTQEECAKFILEIHQQEQQEKHGIN